MTKKQAESEIQSAERYAATLRDRATCLEKAYYNESQEAQGRAVKKIRAHYERIYSKRCAVARALRDKALRRITELKIRHAAVLCGLPIDSLMIEWEKDWEWKQTGRTGKLEVYLQGTLWPKGDYNPPKIGTIIVRVLSKSGKPTSRACRLLSGLAISDPFCKYMWLPEGKSPVEREPKA